MHACLVSVCECSIVSILCVHLHESTHFPSCSMLAKSAWFIQTETLSCWNPAVSKFQASSSFIIPFPLLKAPQHDATITRLCSVLLGFTARLCVWWWTEIFSFFLSGRNHHRPAARETTCLWICASQPNVHQDSCLIQHWTEPRLLSGLHSETQTHHLSTVSVSQRCYC